MSYFNNFLDVDLLKIGDFNIKIYTIVLIFLVFFITNLVLWLIKKAINKYYKLRNIDKGSSYALFQIIKYFIWIITLGILLESIGIKVTVLIAGSAALLVGIGLGLQQTFNDIISGVILLFERSIKVDDILEVDNAVIKIQKIGLRTSNAIDRDDISYIIPNSLITTNKVINWSHQTEKARFRIFVGVAYNSDVELVLKVLKESALQHPEVSDKNLINARLINFNASSLDFELLFYSNNIFRIENVKSDIRININKKFRENNIRIPFPQMDLHLKSDETKNISKS